MVMEKDDDNYKNNKKDEHEIISHISISMHLCRIHLEYVQSGTQMYLAAENFFH